MKRGVEGYGFKDKKRSRGSFRNEKRGEERGIQTQGSIVKGEELMWTVDRTRTRGGRHTGDE